MVASSASSAGTGNGCNCQARSPGSARASRLVASTCVRGLHAQQVSDQVPDGRQEVLAVVEHEEAGLELQLIDHRIPDLAAGPGEQAQSRRDDVVEDTRVPGGGELRDRHRLAEVSRPFGHRQGDAGLADSGRPDDADQAIRADRRLQVDELGLPPQQRGHRGREAATWPGRCTRRRGRPTQRRAGRTEIGQQEPRRLRRADPQVGLQHQPHLLVRRHRGAPVTAAGQQPDEIAVSRLGQRVQQHAPPRMGHGHTGSGRPPRRPAPLPPGPAGAIRSHPGGRLRPVPVQFLGQSRQEQLERRVGHAGVEEIPRLEEVDPDLGVQADVRASGVDERCLHVRQPALDLPQRRPQPLLGTTGRTVGPQSLRHQGTRVGPRVQRRGTRRVVPASRKGARSGDRPAPDRAAPAPGREAHLTLVRRRAAPTGTAAPSGGSRVGIPDGVLTHGEDADVTPSGVERRDQA